MKTWRMIVACGVLCMASMVYAAEEFIPVTPDDSVTSITQVQIKKRVTSTQAVESTYTLPQVDAEIAKIQKRIDHLNGDIAELQALRSKIMEAASKVKLQKDMVVEELK